MMHNEQLADRERAIRELAYSFWEREGYPHGRETEHWFRAEADVSAAEASPARARTAKPAATTPKAAAATRRAPAAPKAAAKSKRKKST